MRAITSIKELACYLKLDKNKRSKIANSSFPLFLPMRLARKIPKNDIDHPLFRQFVPLKAEDKSKSGFSEDPLKEKEALKGLLLRKYEGRALLLTSPKCAMHCRFCFRRALRFEEGKDFFEELSAIAGDVSLSEVILSGGDPLALEIGRLKSLLLKLDAIAHLKRIRIHSRYLIAEPARIEPLLKIFKRLSKQLYFVLHVNHPLELGKDLFLALQKLKMQGVVILTQTVLLKKVNDDEETLYSLFSQLADHGILPYYLHQLDRTVGSVHFEVAIKRGLSLIRALRERLPGYAVPRYVVERPQERSKTELHSVHGL